MYPQGNSALKKLAAAQAAVSVKSEANYRRILAHLFQVHKEYPQLSKLSGLIRQKDFLGAVLESDFLSKQKYGDATTHFVVNQFVLLVKKYPWSRADVDVDREARAKASFMKSEHKCRRVNQRFVCFSRLRSPEEQMLARARAWILHVIGSTPRLDSILSKCDFGPGASLMSKGNATNFPAKIAGDWTSTSGALLYAYNGLCKDDHLRLGCFSTEHGKWLSHMDPEGALASFLQKTHIVKHNNICFVPKTALVDRTIAVEPLWNGYVQKGIDQELRQFLKRIGIDLSDQSRNQRFAREGSIDDSETGFVTIDLSAASDSVSTEVVRCLLPPAWFELLNAVRCRYYKIGGIQYEYHKFCSMGNGFCFPLETLLFCALAHASGCGDPSKSDYSIYGDDIIVRKHTSHELLSNLAVCGFAVNTDKTFLSGPFRESCGADWFGGKDVRPFTLDFKLDTIQNVFKFLNLTCRNAATKQFFQELRPMILDMIPLDFRFVRPFAGPADTGIDSTGDEHLSSPHCTFKRGKWKWKSLASEPVIDFGSIGKSRSLFLERVMLRGARPTLNARCEGFPAVTLRRETKTKVVREDYVSTSNWLPPSGFAYCKSARDLFKLSYQLLAA